MQLWPIERSIRLACRETAVHRATGNTGKYSRRAEWLKRTLTKQRQKSIRRVPRRPNRHRRKKKVLQQSPRANRQRQLKRLRRAFSKNSVVLASAQMMH